MSALIQTAAKHLTLLLLIGLAWGESNSDILVFKNGLQYNGDFLKVEKNKIYFKPKDSSSYQNVFTHHIERVELKNGEILNFKDVNKLNSHIFEKHIDKIPFFELKKGQKILRFDSGQRLIINNDINGAFESVTKEQMHIRSDTLLIPVTISSITKINVQDTVYKSFADGALIGAAIGIVPIAIASIGNPEEAHYGIVFAIVLAPITSILGGLTSLIIPKKTQTKTYPINKNEWEIVYN